MWSREIQAWHRARERESIVPFLPYGQSCIQWWCDFVTEFEQTFPFFKRSIKFMNSNDNFFANFFRHRFHISNSKLILLIQNEIHANKQIDSQSEKEQISLMSQKYFWRLFCFDFIRSCWNSLLGDSMTHLLLPAIEHGNRDRARERDTDPSHINHIACAFHAKISRSQFNEHNLDVHNPY